MMVWHAPTRVMNPSVPQAIIDAATERDPAHARAEYGAQFRSDIESYIKLDVVERCVAVGVLERPPRAGISLQGVRRSVWRRERQHDAGHRAPRGQAGGDRPLLERKPPFSPRRWSRSLPAP